VGPVAAQMILAEIGTDMSRFPTPAHLTSWARFAPGVSESAGRPTGNAGTGKGNRYLARIVGEAAVSAARTDTFLGERYRRIARRRGKKRAIVAVGRSILVVIWALLSDEQAQFVDLGPDFYAARTNPERKVRQHVRELQALCYSVTLNPARLTQDQGIFGSGGFRDYLARPAGCLPVALRGSRCLPHVLRAQVGGPTRPSPIRPVRCRSVPIDVRIAAGPRSHLSTSRHSWPSSRVIRPKRSLAHGQRLADPSSAHLPGLGHTPTSQARIPSTKPPRNAPTNWNPDSPTCGRTFSCMP
jgi:hypothetical protein